MVGVSTLAERLASVRERIERAGGDLEAVRIVAVTKGFGTDAAIAALEAGLTDLGENYAQELLAKAPAVARPRWHFLGALQRNKVKALAPHVALWQALSSLPAGREIARRAPGAQVLVQVNATGESQKHGCAAADAPALVDALRDLGLDVQGLMVVGPAGPAEGARPAFRTVRALADDLGLPERSMGMSDDLEVAVQEGATIVRIGRALFGPRPPRLQLRG